jgi:post-segregation antitoxin (ccd killing protein)
MYTEGMANESIVSKAASAMAKVRWKNVSAAEKSQVASEISQARWEQWRAENPEKAAASEARRLKRAAKKGKS